MSHAAPEIPIRVDNVDVFAGLNRHRRCLLPSWPFSAHSGVSFGAEPRSMRRGSLFAINFSYSSADARGSSSIPDLRPNPLSVVVALLARMAPSARPRPAGDGDPVAPPRVSFELAVEESLARPGAANDRRRAS